MGSLCGKLFMMKNKLKMIRLKYKYSYADMARMLNISRTYYWQLENKKRRLYYFLAQNIATIFNTKPDDIFYEKQDKLH